MVCLHTGSSAWAPLPSPSPPFELLPTLFPVNALIAAAEWLWSGVPLRFPGLAVALSEGGIGWVPMLADRVDYVLDHSASGTESVSWPSELRPSEVLKRNFWFCTIDDPSVVDLLAGHRDGPRHGGERLSPRRFDLARHPGGHAVDAGRSGRGRLRMVAAGNAARLFRHPLPPADDWRGLRAAHYPISPSGSVSCWISMVLPAGSVNQIWTVVPWAPST